MGTPQGYGRGSNEGRAREGNAQHIADDDARAVFGDEGTLEHPRSTARVVAYRWHGHDGCALDCTTAHVGYVYSVDAPATHPRSIAARPYDAPRTSSARTPVGSPRGGACVECRTLWPERTCPHRTRQHGTRTYRADVRPARSMLVAGGAGL